MKRIGARLVQERKLALSEGASEDDTEGGREYGKDLLSLLVKANMTDPEASSMSDEDVQDREFLSHSDLVLVPYFTYDGHRAHTFLSSPYRNRHFHCRRPRNKQRWYRLVLSLFIQQPRGARAPAQRDPPSWYRFARC